MKMINNLKDFLIDKEYYIDIFDSKLHAFNYQELLKLSSNNINLKFATFILEIDGNNLKILQMNKEEILIDGELKDMRIKR